MRSNLPQTSPTAHSKPKFGTPQSKIPGSAPVCCTIICCSDILQEQYLATALYIISAIKLSLQHVASTVCAIYH